MTKDQQDALRYTAIGGLSLYLAYRLFFKERKRKLPAFYTPGAFIETFQGAQLTLRVPSGRYESLSPLVTIVAEAEAGNATDVIVQVGASVQPYTENLILVNVDRPTEQHRFTIVARKGVSA